MKLISGQHGTAASAPALQPSGRLLASAPRRTPPSNLSNHISFFQCWTNAKASHLSSVGGTAVKMDLSANSGTSEVHLKSWLAQKHSVPGTSQSMEQSPRTAEMPYRIQGLRPDTSTSAVSRTLSKLRLGTESAQPECASHHLGRHYSHGVRLYPDQKSSHVVKPDKVKWKMLDHSESLKRPLPSAQAKASPQPNPLSLSIPPTLSGLNTPNIYLV